MLPFDCEKHCKTRILALNDAKYCVGLFVNEGLLVKGEWVISIVQNPDGVWERFDYNLKTNELKKSKKETEDSGFLSITIHNLESNSLVDVSTNGMRAEGCCVNNSPFGWVCLMNEFNELVYRGIMIGDKKECFGTEFYSDLGQIEYIGCYWNNERHGFGMLYDRKGELLYEGDWLFGSNEYEMNVVLKSIDNDRMVHSLIRELVIAEGCGNEMKDDLILCGFEKLESIVVKKGSLKNLKSLKISDNSVLKRIEIGNDTFYEDRDPFIGVLCYVESVIIDSMMIYD